MTYRIRKGGCSRKLFPHFFLVTNQQISNGHLFFWAHSPVALLVSNGDEAGRSLFLFQWLEAMFEMIGLVGAAALRCQLAGCRGYCGVTRIGIRNTYLVLFLVCEIVSVFYVFFCLFVPLFDFVSRIQVLRFG